MQEEKQEVKRENKEEAINDKSQHVSGKHVINVTFIAIAIVVVFAIINEGTPFYKYDVVCGKDVYTVDWTEIAQTFGGLTALYFLLPFILNNKNLKPLYAFIEKLIIKWRTLQN